MTVSSSDQDFKHQLAELAHRLSSNLDELKRPLVIEFSGTPKSGKSTCVDAVTKFFRRHNIPVYLVTERASVCPISNKQHLFFNAWTGATSLAQMLAALEHPVGVVILDRGLFDSLVWMHFLAERQAVSATEIAAIEQFFLLERWVSRVDIVVSISVSPERALEREFNDQITDIHGSIMNPDTLKAYNASLEYCLKKYKQKFNRLIHLDTTNKRAVEGVTEIAFEVLNTADDLLDEQIAVVDKEIVENHMPSGGVMAKQEQISDFLNILVDNIHWLRRSDAEKDANLVQIVPATAIRKEREILVMTIRDKEGSRLTNRVSVWAGGHARKTDVPKRGHRKTLFRRCLERELDEELHLQMNHNNLSALPKVIVWDNTSPKSLQHLGLLYEYVLPTTMPREVLHRKEIWETQRTSLFTQFRRLGKSLYQVQDWETWSCVYLKQIHNLDVPVEPKQGYLFPILTNQ